MSIKQAQIEHFDIVKQITVQTIETVYPHYYPKGAVGFFLAHHSDDNILEDIKSGNVFVFEQNGVIIGTVTITENEICRLFVLPQYQGNGYGKGLLDFCETYIFKNHNNITLSASLPAKEIYNKRGYMYKSSHSIYTECGDYLCYDIMEKTADSCSC